MRKPYLTLSFGLLLAAGGFALLHTVELRARNGPAPIFQPDLLCPDLALLATPGRLITQAQAGVSAVLNCRP
jgi:hypothetical protein